MPSESLLFTTADAGTPASRAKVPLMAAYCTDNKILVAVFARQLHLFQHSAQRRFMSIEKSVVVTEFQSGTPQHEERVGRLRRRFAQAIQLTGCSDSGRLPVTVLQIILNTITLLLERDNRTTSLSQAHIGQRVMLVSTS
jgi:hypothetical protein